MHKYGMAHSYVTWLIHTRDITHTSMQHDSFVCDMTDPYVWHVSFICVTWLMHLCDESCHTCICVIRLDMHICDITYAISLMHRCDLTYSTVSHDLFMCVTWLIHVSDMNHPSVQYASCICVTSLICVTGLVRMCDMTHSYLWHGSFICDMTHSYSWHDSFIRVTWLIHTCDMTHLYAWHDCFICVTWLIHMCDVTHLHVWYIHVDATRVSQIFNTVQHTATHCSTLHNTTKHCNTL